MFSPWRGRWGEPPTASTTSPAMWACLLGSGSSCPATTVAQREADPSKCQTQTTDPLSQLMVIFKATACGVVC